MLSFKEYREPTRQLVDELPWALLEAPGVVRLKSGALMRCIAYRGHDAEILLDVEQVVIAAQTNAALMRLGQGWSLFSEVRRTPVTSYPHTPLAPGAAQIVEDIRRENLGRQSTLYHTEYVLTLVWSPPTSKAKSLAKSIARFFGGFFEGGEHEHHQEVDALSAQRQEELAQFLRTTRDLAGTLSLACAEIHFMDDAEVLSFLHETISTQRHPITPPDVPMYIDALLADEPVQCGLEMMLGRDHVRVISIKGYPNLSSPDMLRELETMDIPFRMASRFICLTQDEAIKAIDTYHKLLEGQQESVNPLVDKHSARAVDSWIVEQAQEAMASLEAVRRGEVTFGHHSLQIVVRHQDYKTCQLYAEEMVTICHRLGFACVEESANLREAWFSTLPGHLWANPRRAIISSMNMAHMLCTQAIWQGDLHNTHLGGPPHMVCRTSGQTPFYFNVNVNDVGHTLILGPTGGGKSTLLVSMIIQWMKYKHAQVIAFDKGRSSRAATLALGGTFLELSVDKPEITFQPLGRIDEPREFEFVLTWLEEVATLEKLEVDIEARQALRHALTSLKSAPKHLRTMTGLTLALQHRGLRQAFSPFCQGTHGEGVYAPLWDNDHESLGLSRVTAIEMEQLMDTNPRLIAMTLRYLFHRVEEQLTGVPTLLVLDEAWIFLSHPMFAQRIKEWLKVLRKKNTYVLFATQDMNDALSSSIAPTLLQNCPTQILLANPKAMDETVYQAYRTLGLSRGQIEAISRLQREGDRGYYLHNSRGSRVFHLGLSPLELALADNSVEAHKRMDLAQRTARKTGDSYLALYLEYSGFQTQAHRLREALVQQRQNRPDTFSLTPAQGGRS